MKLVKIIYFGDGKEDVKVRFINLDKIVELNINGDYIEIWLSNDNMIKIKTIYDKSKMEKLIDMCERANFSISKGYGWDFRNYQPDALCY